jgi:hypothetical protein
LCSINNERLTPGTEYQKPSDLYFELCWILYLGMCYSRMLGQVLVAHTNLRVASSRFVVKKNEADGMKIENKENVEKE